ncbi:MAG: hypothetical protein ACLR2G_10220 [Phascolarctobacterium faecium]
MVTQDVTLLTEESLVEPDLGVEKIVGRRWLLERGRSSCIGVGRGL